MTLNHSHVRYRHYTIVCLLLLCVVFISIPRFNRQDRFGLEYVTVKGKPATIHLADAGQYLLLSKYYKYGVVDSRLQAPFAYRPLVPYLASWLPNDSMTAINIVNIIALMLSVICLIGILKHYRLSDHLIYLGCLLYIFSFPMLYYSSIGIIDPMLIACFTLCLYTLLNGRLVIFLGALLLGTLTKETIIIILPVLAVHLLFHPMKFSQKIMWLMLALITYLCGNYFVRIISLTSSTFVWGGALKYFVFNLTSWKTWTKNILTFGLPGLLFCYLLVERYCRSANIKSLIIQLLPCITGIAATFAVVIYALFDSKFAGGRFLWPIYPFIIPCCMVLLQDKWLGNHTQQTLPPNQQL